MDPIRDSLTNPMVLIVRESRAAAWPQAKLILESIPNAAPRSAELKAYYFIVTTNRELYAKAMALIDLLGHTKALQIYVNGSVKRGYWQLRQMGECFLKATKLPDSRKYCHVLHEHEERRQTGVAFPSIQVNIFPSEDKNNVQDQSRVVRRTLVPCRFLYERIRYELNEMDVDRFTVRSIDVGVDMCPLFDSRMYAEVFPKFIGSDGQVITGLSDES